MSVYIGHTCVDWVNTAFGASEKKPYAYELQYLIMSGRQYINTRVIPNDLETKMTLKMKDMDTVGCILQASENEYYQLCRYSGNWTFGTNGTEYQVGAMALNTLYDITYNQIGTHDFIVNDTVVKTGIANITAYDNKCLLIGGYRPDVSYTTGSDLCVYKATLTDRQTGIVLRNLIPVVDNVGQACFYDTVTKAFFYNELNSTSFKAGPAIDGSFKELEYLVVTGTQWIDTEVVPSTTIRTTAKVTRSTLDTCVVVGTLQGNYTSYQFTFFQNGYSVCPGGGADDTTYGLTTNTPYVIDYNINSSHNCTIDGQRINNTTAAASGSMITLFKRGTEDMNLTGRFYYCNMYSDYTTPIRQFIPVVDSASTVCLYDKISKQYFYNQGSGEFIAGPFKS